MLARMTASIVVIGLFGCSRRPFAAHVCMIRVVFVWPSPSEGPTGPVDIVATIALSSQFVPGLLWCAHGGSSQPFQNVSPSDVQKLSCKRRRRGQADDAGREPEGRTLLGLIPTAQNSKLELPMKVLAGPA